MDFFSFCKRNKNKNPGKKNENQDQNKFSSVCQRSNYRKNFNLRDLLLEICVQCDDFDITQFVTCVKDMKNLITTSSQCESSTQMIL